MTDTSRTTVTLTNSYMKLVDELVGVYGTTKAQVISKIVENFFDSKENIPLLNELEKRKRKLGLIDKSILEKKIQNYIKWAASGTALDNFIKDLAIYLDVSRDFIISHFHKWIDKYNLKVNENKVFK